MAVVWAVIAVFGGFCCTTARRVYFDSDWEDADWWVLSSWAGFRGAIFGMLFPVVRTEHTRSQERTNALWIMAWGFVLLGIGIAMALYERSH